MSDLNEKIHGYLNFELLVLLAFGTKNGKQICYSPRTRREPSVYPKFKREITAYVKRWVISPSQKIKLAYTDRASRATVWQNNTKSFVSAPERKDDLNRSRMSDLNDKIRG